jgi:hypothetical protein
MPNFSRAELQAIVAEAAETASERTVEKTLRGLGVDVDNPLEMQQDFQSLREFRKLMGLARRKVFLTLLGLVVVGLVAAAGAYVKFYVLGR